MNTREEHAVLALCMATMSATARATLAEVQARVIAVSLSEKRRQLAAAHERCAALGAELDRVKQTLGAVASAHGGRMEVSEHLLMRGPWDVHLTVDPVNHRHYVTAERR